MFDVLLTRFAAEDSEEASGFAALGFDAKAFLIQLVTFLIIFYLLRRFVFARIVDLLEKRRKTIEAGVTLSAKMKREKEEFDKLIAQQRADARREADKILADTHAQAGQIIKAAEDSAQEKAEYILAESRQKIDDETARAKRNLEKEMVELVIQATEAVTKQKLDAEKDNELIADALKARA